MRVRGYCPMGCGETDCPDPTKLADLLDDRETEHVVEVGETSFNVLHPMRERGGELFACELHSWMSALAGPPRVPGCYRAIRDGHGWRFEAVRS